MESKLYLLRIELLNTQSPVWREVMVPSDLLLSDLDEVIQAAVGWAGDHVTLFEYKGQVYQSIEFMDQNFGKTQEVTQLDELLKDVHQTMTYTYQLGDHWRHSVILQKILPGDGVVTLKCLDGYGDCPEEDSFEPFDIEAVNVDLAVIALDLEEDIKADDPLLDQIFSGDFLKDDTGLEAFNILSEMDGDDADEDIDEIAEPYLDLTDASCGVFRDAMGLGETLRDLKPWKDLWDQDVFCIKDPDSGLLDFVSVLGRGGEVFALHVHHGAEAGQFWKQTMQGTLSMEPEVYMRSLKMTEIEFTNKSQMDEPDLDLYKRTRFLAPDRDSQRWVRFRRYHPRAGAPWFPDFEELPRLMRAIRLCVRYIELLRGAPKATRCKYERQDARDGSLPKVLPCFTLAKEATPRALSGEDTAAWGFSQASIDWEASDAIDIRFEPLEFELQQLANLPQVDEAWELGAIYLNTPVGSSNGPVLPILSVAVPLGVAMDAPPQPYLGAELEIYPAEAIWRGFAKAALGRGCRPAEVHVVTHLGESTLKPLESLCQTRIVRQQEFQQLQELLNMMGQM